MMKTLKKNLFLVAVLIITVYACKKDDGGGATLVGKWKLVQSKVGTGGPGQWVDIPGEQSTYVQFNANGALAGTAFAEYTAYAVKDSVTLVFSKTDGSKQNYSYAINNGLLDLSPAGPIFCIEGCTYRFSRF